MALSKKERLQRKAKKEAQRRNRIRNDPALLDELNRKRRAKYAKDRAVREQRKQKMSQRDVRHVRQKWKLAKRRQREFLKSKSENPEVKHQAITGKRRKRRNQDKQYYIVRKLQLEIDQLKSKVHKYKKRYQRLIIKTTAVSNSPKSKCSRELKKESVSPKIKRKLLFADALSADLKSSYKSLQSKKSKMMFTSSLSLKYVAKYRFMTAAKPFFPWNVHVKKQRFGVAGKSQRLVQKEVEKFFNSDDVSTQAPGKKDFITSKKIRKQKRYLNNTLLFLHQKFCNDNPFVISYSAFCKLKPFWVVKRKIHERETCLCVKCENMNLITRRMKEEKILKSSCIDKIIDDEMCCGKERATSDCMFRKCNNCREKMIEFGLFVGEQPTYYDTWKSQMEKGRDGKSYRRKVKVRIQCTCYELVNIFHKMLTDYMPHLGNLRHQYNSITKLKECLTDKDLLIHIDFSENYGCKWTREIQSCHFGGNRLQITLHTGVLYMGKNTHQSFCTVSTDLHHDPVAIYTHLQPILVRYPQIKSLHFLSDSPSSQYRNTGMIYLMINHIIPMFPHLEIFSWNYSESGHGKGAPDGIGATIKRTCDQIIASGVADISDFSQFNQCIQDNLTKKINVIPITENRDAALYNILQSLSTVKGE